MARVATALTQWQTNHQNDLPESTDSSAFGINYMKEGADPTAGGYEYVITEFTTNSVSGTKGTGNSIANGEVKDADVSGNVYIVTGATCSGDKAVASNTRDYAVLYRLEGSGVICVDNGSSATNTGN